MADDVIYRFLDRGRIPGIPARDLTARDMDRLTPLQQRDVAAGTLYEPAKAPGKKTEPPPARKPARTETAPDGATEDSAR